MRVFCGARLTEIRQARGLRPEQLAVAVDRSAASIFGYESGRIVPPMQVVYRIARALDVEPIDLFAEADK